MKNKKVFSILIVLILIFVTKFSLTAQAKVDWDRSSLKFDSEFGCQSSCSEVSAKIINGGSDMAGESSWELYYSEKGNPKNGEIVASGVIPPLKSNEHYIITVNLQELNLESTIGIYKFKAYQRPGHPGIGVLWSEDCVVLCHEQDVPLISLNKEVSHQYSKPGETITFTFEIKNIGNVDLT
jgi:YqxM protein